MPVVRGSRTGTRTLPPEAVEGLRGAFRNEVAERLPRLQAVHGGSPPHVLADALRDAHSLGSSAVVLGEPQASRVARAIESALLEGDLTGVPAQVEVLCTLLEAWR